MNPEVQQAINNINQYIVENHNNEITANILNPILVELANLFDLVGDLSELNTTDKDSVVDAINEAISLIAPGTQIHTGTEDPNVTPPAAYAVGDLYSRLTIGGGDPYQIYMFNGVEWGEIKRFINDAITSNEYSWSSQKISDAILGNRLLNSPTIVIDENDITISDLQWVINGNTYILSPAYTETIPYTSEAGKVRTDIIVGIQANELLRIQGVEGDVAVAPALPANTVLVTTIDVFHDSLGDVQPPISGELYVKKMSYRNLYLTGSVATAPVLSEDKRNTVIQSYTGSMVIDGFKDGMPGQPSTLYQGMVVTIDNQTAEEVPLNDMTNSTHPNSDIKMDFRAGISQYTMKPGEVITFKLRGTTLVFVSTNKAETDVEVPTKTSDLTNDGADGTSTYVEHDELGTVATSNDYEDLDNLPSLDFVPTADVGVANGVAPTDSGNKIPLSFFPDAILGQVVFGGTVVPTTGVATLSANAKTKLGTTDATITLTNDTTPITGYEANEGIYYIAFDDGTFGGITLTVGDWLISTGSGWSKIDNTDAVTMVNGKTGTVTLNSEDIPYNNTTSGLDAENAQDAIDEVQANIEQETTDRQLAIETAGFASRTGTEIHFDKWATYDSYDSPSDGDFSYDLTNAVVGMIQVAYHEDSLVPTFSQVGIDVITIGEYQPDIVNRVVFELIGATRILVNVTPL